VDVGAKLECVAVFVVPKGAKPLTLGYAPKTGGQISVPVR